LELRLTAHVTARARVVLAPCAFFFSSRRRHTRFSRDWSSDVCSSDLGALFMNQSDNPANPAGYAGFVEELLTQLPDGVDAYVGRSEERRVGKERRSGWRAVLEKK